MGLFDFFSPERKAVESLREEPVTTQDKADAILDSILDINRQYTELQELQSTGRTERAQIQKPTGILPTFAGDLIDVLEEEDIEPEKEKEQDPNKPLYSVLGRPLNDAARIEVEEKMRQQRIEQKQKEQLLVKEIHERVDTAALTAINHSPRIAEIDEKIAALLSDPVASRASRRKAIGFGVTKTEQSTLVQVHSEVGKFEYERDKLMDERDKITELEEMRAKHPGRKFILRSELDAICEKYHLALGYTLFYVGEIPEKNLQDIENYVPLEEELKMIRLSLEHRGWGRAEYSTIYTPNENESLGSAKRRILERFKANYIAAQSSRHMMFGGRRETDYGKERAEAEMRDFGVEKISTEEINTFLIACPHIDLTQTINHVEEKYVNDPIVCKIVGKPHILEVVTKWGPEAEETSVQDEPLQAGIKSIILN